jgi:uncharacterized protein
MSLFWGTHSGAELDLLLIKDGRCIGVECKRVDAPRLTPSMRTALTDLDLDQLLVIYLGVQPYALTENIKVVPLKNLAQPESLDWLGHGYNKNLRNYSNC